MSFRRPASDFRNEFGGTEFPFAADRYILYVSYACPWATGLLMTAKLRGLVSLNPSKDGSGCHRSGEDGNKVSVCFVHPTWQYTNPDADAKIEAELEAEKAVNGESDDDVGIPRGEAHAGWIFGKPGTIHLPIAIMKNGGDYGLELPGSPTEICGGNGNNRDSFCYGNPAYEKAIETFGVRSEGCSEDLSEFKARSLRDLYEACGGFMSEGVRASTPMLYDTHTKRIVLNESKDLNRYFCQFADWLISEEGGGNTGLDGPSGVTARGFRLYPESLRAEIDEKTEWVYTINNGVYRCGFTCTQETHNEACTELETRMLEVDSYLEGGEGGKQKHFLVADQLTLADIRLFNTLIRINEVYICYFKCTFASLLQPRFKNLLRYTAGLWNGYEEVRSCIRIDDIMNHYYTSHSLRNAYAIVPRKSGFIEILEGMK